MLAPAKRLAGSLRDKILRDPVNAQALDIQRSMHDVALRAEWDRAIGASKNPLARFGAKHFSQGDEDGVLLEILRRIGVKNGAFAELGVGNGLENNTLILLAAGWRGFWVGGQPLAFDHTINPQRFRFYKDWIDLANILPLVTDGLRDLAIESPDVLSLDLDGNDYYFIRHLLHNGIRPSVFILEYNAKFPPPIKWSIAYNDKHAWDGSDYFGASLALFCELMQENGYRLVCCNAATGANAFFVRDEYRAEFADVPDDIRDIFVGPRYGAFENFAHRPSAKTIERMLA
jgi:hypothetical protein